ncbi:MAG: hypothetical protein WBB95_18105 [Pseudomonas sp.]|uniref:hypothetical protein n=1 Tax=Pseudomonas sp. TaxID=306 RepID=UPI003C7601A5
MNKLVKATMTPLASIFGSGFLVIVPILAGAVGPFSVWAMLAVCALAYAVGHVIRFNIQFAEPVLASESPPKRLKFIEGSSDIALVGAYVISVCLYINILASFLLGGLNNVWSGIDTPFHEHLLTAGVIAVIGAIGYFKGLDMLESLEDIALWITLAIIGALFVGFGMYDWREMSGAGIQWPVMPANNWWQILTIVGGTLIVVQGFETTRYLGDEFDSKTRISACRWSQIISTVVYLIFILLATPLMHFLGKSVEDNALIMLAGKAATWLPLPLVAAAVLSQFSAAVADTMGGGGNMVEATHKRVNANHAYLIICSGAICLAFAPTLTILTLASKAFAFYYMLQCFVAIGVSKNATQKMFFGAIALVLAFIAIFAVPAG